ncbi:preprotein translocase subunit YajC [Bifidobacterium bombi]
MLFMLIIIVVMVLMMWWSTRKNKQQQSEVKNFRESLQPGTLVVTIGGVIGKVVSIDTKYEEIVLDSDGSLLRFRLSSVSKEYVRPAFIDDEDVDADGNPIVDDAAFDQDEQERAQSQGTQSAQISRDSSDNDESSHGDADGSGFDRTDDGDSQVPDKGE